MLLELDNINDSIFSFKEEWERNMFFVSLSSPHREINKINEQIVLLEEALENDNAVKVKEIRALIKLYIEEISKHERLHIDNII
jgi:U3 small nucleolar RNA-associated protein 14